MNFRFGLSLALAIAASVAVALTSAGRSSGQGSLYSSVNGSVKVTFPNFPAAGESTTEQLVVSATNGLNGTQGTIEFRSPLAAVPVAIADVTCLLVNGNEAKVGGTIRQPFTYGAPDRGFPNSRILYFSILIHDNGSPGHDTPDGVHPVVFDDRPRSPTFTPCNLPQLLLYPVDQGNLIVRAAAS